MVVNMSALFPNVPDAPGVPAVARAGGQLQVIANGAGTAVSAATDALEAIGNSQFVAANAELLVTIGGATNALNAANSIMSTTSEISGSLAGTVAGAQNAIDALASGDPIAAARAVERTIENAERAYNAVTALISPPAQEPLGGSGEEVNADTARQWGLFTQDGDFAAPADNVIALEVGLEARISDYPVAPNTAGSPTETVGFGSYNKVVVPYDVRLIMSRGGSVEDRQDFLKAVQDAWQSVELFNVVTPECVYLDVNVVGVRRLAAPDRGATLMSLEIALRKVRQTATLTFVQTKEPSGSGQVKDGSVQARQPADAQQYAGAGR